MAVGIALVIIGMFLLLRTVREDSEGKTLVDRITGK